MGLPWVDSFFCVPFSFGEGTSFDNKNKKNAFCFVLCSLFRTFARCYLIMYRK